MKKIIFMAVLAVAFIACNKNKGSEVEMPAEEKKAVTAGTSEMVSQLGHSEAKVDKHMASAGYTKAETFEMPFVLEMEEESKMPAHKLPQAKVKKADDENETYVSYIYGLPEEYRNMSQDQAAQYINTVLAKGESFIVVTALFSYEKLTATGTVYLVPQSDDANKRYAVISKKMHKKLSGYGYRSWFGGFWDNMEGGDPKYMYADGNVLDGADAELDGKYSAFIDRLEGMTIAYVQESGAGTSGNAYHMKGFGYGSSWIYPNQDDQAKLQAQGITVPCALGSIGMAYYDTAAE